MATRYVPLSNFDRLAASFFAPSRTMPRLDRQIPVDAVQRHDALVLEFDLPGVSEDRVELSLERRHLSVRAERPSTITEDDSVFLAERPTGTMSREIVLGESLDFDHVTANLENGVLTVRIPLAAQSRSRKIEIGHAPVNASSEDNADGS